MHYMTTAREMIESCACHKVRMAARAVTRAYDEALRPVGLRATQVSLLAAIAAEEALSISALAQLLGMDRSTLTRNLAPLEKEGLTRIGAEGWRRSRTLSLTAKGRQRLQAAMPLWEGVQKHLKHDLGEDGWSKAQGSLDELIRTGSVA